jgi:hypothetical protein
MRDIVIGLCIHRYESGLRVETQKVQICNTTPMPYLTQASKASTLRP